VIVGKNIENKDILRLDGSKNGIIMLTVKQSAYPEAVNTQLG